MTTRRVTFLAILTGVAAVVLVVAAAQGGGDSGDPDGNEWILGLLLIVMPLVCAAVVRSVASSTLLRPVGVVATLLCAAASALHVALAVDGQGRAGWLYGVPALATTALLITALVRGPDRRDTPAMGMVWDGVSVTPTSPQPQDYEEISGPPLDVVTPLRQARNHASKSVLAWLVVIAALTALGVPVLTLFGWPTVVARLDGQVVDMRPSDDGVAVMFTAQDARRTVRWTLFAQDPGWEVGERTVAYLDEDDRVHLDQQFGLAGIPLLMPGLLVGVFSLFAVRRLWGIAVAWWDVRNDQDRPRLGYAAVIDDPAPKTWRPLLAVWELDPTTQQRLAKPDAVYRADDETGADLQCPPASVVVRRAWIDTGIWSRSKPRWVGFEDGVAVPHRRSLFGRWYVHVVTRRASVARVVALHHGPPAPGLTATAIPPWAPRHRLGGMIAWRMLAAVLGIVLAFTADQPGQPAEIGHELSSTAPAWASDARNGGRTAGVGPRRTSVEPGQNRITIRA